MLYAFLENSSNIQKDISRLKETVYDEKSMHAHMNIRKQIFYLHCVQIERFN